MEVWGLRQLAMAARLTSREAAHHGKTNGRTALTMAQGLPTGLAGAPGMAEGRSQTKHTGAH